MHRCRHHREICEIFFFVFVWYLEPHPEDIDFEPPTKRCHDNRNALTRRQIAAAVVAAAVPCGWRLAVTGECLPRSVSAQGLFLFTHKREKQMKSSLDNKIHV